MESSPRSWRGFGAVDKLDVPAHLGAYLHALKWSAVSADAKEGDKQWQSLIDAGLVLKKGFRLKPPIAGRRDTRRMPQSLIAFRQSRE